MKTSSILKTLSVGILLLTATAAITRADLISSFGFDLGAADQTASGNDYVVFTLGGSIIDSDSISRTNLNVSDEGILTGDVGIAGTYNAGGTYTSTASSNSNLIISGDSIINGDAYIDQFGSRQRSNGATVTGSTVISGGADQTHTDLQQGVLDARDAITQAGALAHNYMGMAAGTSIEGNKNLNFTTSGRNDNVVNIKDFELDGKAKLTLTGTASQSVIINVSRNFSLSGTSKIQLAGGLTWDNVIFNVKGSKDVELSGQSKFKGYLLAGLNDVDISGKSKFKGELIAGGSKVKISGKAKIIKPAHTSPVNP
jgi:hypothetical protein